MRPTLTVTRVRCARCADCGIVLSACTELALQAAIEIHEAYAHAKIVSVHG